MDCGGWNGGTPARTVIDVRATAALDELRMIDVATLGDFRAVGRAGYSFATHLLESGSAARAQAGDRLRDI